MDVTTPRPTLLSAAKNFIRKSAGTAVLAIAPLAAVSVAQEAKAQAFFSLPNSGGTHVASNGATGYVSGSGSFFNEAYLTNGVRLVRTGGFVTSGGFSGGLITFSLNAPGTITPGLGLNHSVDFTYDFTLGVMGGSGVLVNSWSLQAWFEDSSYTNTQTVTIASGSGLGQHTGGSTFLTPLTSNDFYALSLVLNVSAPSSRLIQLQMNSGSGQGVTLNAAAIPEPSTYAALFGLGALGFVLLRRVRRTV